MTTTTITAEQQADFAATIDGLRRIVVEMAELSPGIFAAFRTSEAFDMADDFSGDKFSDFQKESRINEVFDLAELIGYLAEWSPSGAMTQVNDTTVEMAQENGLPTVVDALRARIDDIAEWASREP